MGQRTSLAFGSGKLAVEGSGRYGEFSLLIGPEGGTFEWSDWESALPRRWVLSPGDVGWKWSFPYRSLWASVASSILWDLPTPITGSPWDPNVRRLTVTLRPDRMPSGQDSEYASRLIQFGRPRVVPTWRRGAIAAEIWMNEMPARNWRQMCDQTSFEAFHDSLPRYFCTFKRAKRIFDAWYSASRGNEDPAAGRA